VVGILALTMLLSVHTAKANPRDKPGSA